jgi:hypothetical protein
MKLRKEVVNRLVLAKSILSSAVGSSSLQANSHLVARQLLNSHDAADLVFAAIADQKGKLVTKGKAPSMMDCLAFLGEKAHPYNAYFKQLNDARNSVKHVGNLPNTHQWSGVAEDVLEKLSALCKSMLGKRLEDISELELVLNADVRAHLKAGDKFRRSGGYKEALEEIGKAVYVALREKPDLWDIELGKPKAEDALKLTGLGIPANDFLRLQGFLPQVSKFFSDPFIVLWEQSKFGHPGNWRDDVVDFCLEQSRVVALGVQTALNAPFAAEFSFLYGYRILAREDRVEVWEDLVDGHLDDAGNSRLFRAHKRYLNKGESIEVSAWTHPFISDDISPAGDWIKRVRVSTNPYSALVGNAARAEFVDLAQVCIVCVPKTRGMGMARFEDLQEIEWKPDPDLHRELSSMVPDSLGERDAQSQQDAGNS